MSFPFSKPIIASTIVLALLVVGVFAIVRMKQAPEPPKEQVDMSKDIGFKYEVIGKSLEGREIQSYTYGAGSKHIVFVGGIHGGYEWNSVLLSYQFIDYLKKSPALIPANLKVTVIPSANPDGLYKVTGKVGRFAVTDVNKSQAVLASGRFNARDVDLNRNFDCKWKPTGTWQSKTVSAGSKAFSEPEAQALRNFVVRNT
ncbi:MAG: M14 family zinc carboxypeptidase, partial [Patescibacteria group bacterium]